jgi:hypothetical protein
MPHIVALRKALHSFYMQLFSSHNHVSPIPKTEGTRSNSGLPDKGGVSHAVPHPHPHLLLLGLPLGQY